MIYLFKIANLFVHQPNSVKLVAVTFFIPTQSWLIKRQSCHHIKTSQLICRANQLTGFYMIATLAFNELSKFFMPFLFHIRNYSSEVRTIQRCEVNLNIILSRVNYFRYQTWHSILVLLYTPSAKQNKIGWMLTRE